MLCHVFYIYTLFEPQNDHDEQIHGRRDVPPRPQMKIGGITLERGIALAPMAGITDRAMRELAVGFGAEYTVTEMISAKAVCYGSAKTEELAVLGDAERPAAIQIFGSEPDFMAEAAERLCGRYSPDAIDINMGCPMKKIVSNGEGSALMKDPALAASIVSAVKKRVKVPVTVKIRSGWDENSINAPDLARRLEAAGADMICVHGRTKTQLYGGRADRGVIAAVKRAVSVPVMGNGDIFSARDATDMMGETGCDGVMIARGCEGRPWIFAEIAAAMDGRTVVFDAADRKAALRRHMELIIKYKGERGIAPARAQLAWYMKGFRGAAALRAKAVAVETAEDIAGLISAMPDEDEEYSETTDFTYN